MVIVTCVMCVEVSVHLFFYCIVVITCLYVVGHVVVPCIWEVCLIRGFATVLATHSFTASPTAFSVLHAICRCGRCCCNRSAALLLLPPALAGSL